MAIGAGSIVAQVNKQAGVYTGPAQMQPPAFGVVTSLNSSPVGADVLWPQDGHIESGIPLNQLDEIVDPDAGEVARLIGNVVRFQPGGAGAMSFVADYDAVLVQMYKRAQAGGAAGPTLALVQVIQTGLFLEFESSYLQPAIR